MGPSFDDVPDIVITSTLTDEYCGMPVGVGDLGLGGLAAFAQIL